MGYSKLLKKHQKFSNREKIWFTNNTYLKIGERVMKKQITQTLVFIALIIMLDVICKKYIKVLDILNFVQLGFELNTFAKVMKLHGIVLFIGAGTILLFGGLLTVFFSLINKSNIKPIASFISFYRFFFAFFLFNIFGGFVYFICSSIPIVKNINDFLSELILFRIYINLPFNAGYDYRNAFINISVVNVLGLMLYKFGYFKKAISSFSRVFKEIQKSDTVTSISTFVFLFTFLSIFTTIDIYAQPSKNISGIFEKTHIDEINSRTRDSYLLHTKDKVINLRQIPVLKKFEIGDSINVITDLTFNRLKTINTVTRGNKANYEFNDTLKCLVLLLSFTDSGPIPLTREQIIDGGGTEKRINNFFQESSYGKICFQMKVYDWYKLYRPAFTPYFMPTLDEFGEIFKNNSIDISNYNRVIYFMNYEHLIDGSGYSGFASTGSPVTSKIWMPTVTINAIGWQQQSLNSLSKFKSFEGILIHELGHTLGQRVGTDGWSGSGVNGYYIVHAQSYNLKTKEIIDYGSNYDVMGSGGISYDLNAIFKERLGWLDNNSITSIGGSGVYTIKALHCRSGVRAAKLLSPTNRKYEIYLEYRKPLGIDTSLIRYTPNTQGIIANVTESFLDTQIHNKMDIWTYLLDLAPNDFLKIQPEWDWNIVALYGNKSIEIPNKGITLGPVVSFDDSTVTFKVEYTMPVGINSEKVPISFSLGQNYPNPFNPTTKIKYSVPQASSVTLQVYDILGRELTKLVNEEKLPGNYEVDFKASGLSSGIYFYRITAVPSTGSGQTFLDTKKFILMK